MRYIKLGRTGLDVSPIAIGAMTCGEPLRGHPVWSLDEEASRPLIKHALRGGHQLLRHSEYLFAGDERGNSRTGAARLRQSRRHSDRDESAPSDDAELARLSARIGIKPAGRIVAILGSRAPLLRGSREAGARSTTEIQRARLRSEAQKTLRAPDRLPCSPPQEDAFPAPHHRMLDARLVEIDCSMS
jgi:hypothetical protein